MLCPNTRSFQTGDPSKQHLHASLLFCFPQPGAPPLYPPPSSRPLQVSLALLCCRLLGWTQWFLVLFSVQQQCDAVNNHNFRQIISEF